MNENKVYGALLLALMAAAYVSWTQDKDAGGRDSEVTLVEAKPDDLRSIRLRVKTSTVHVSFQQDPGGDTYAWFEITSKANNKRFVGNQAFMEKGRGAFAPLKALRSLGRLSGKELELTKLEKDPGVLTLEVGGSTRIFELGARTHGARDHYVRERGKLEVFLVPGRLVTDLEFPQARFMQKKLRSAPLKEVAKISLAGGGQSQQFFHKNRLAEKQSYWTIDADSDTVHETAGNYLDKLEKLTAAEYLKNRKLPEGLDPVLEAQWFDDNDKTLGKLTLWRQGQGKGVTYYGQSTATRGPVKVHRFIAEQVERDLKDLLSNP